MKTSANVERVDIRIPGPIKERLRKVATLSGRTMSDFIVAAALEKAEEVTASIERWELDEEDSRVALDLLMQHRDVPGLRELLAVTDPQPEHALIPA